jgi:hypothetical protein
MTALTDEAKKRAEAMQQAAEYRRRAAEYTSLADEANQRGDMEHSVQFFKLAAQELDEARLVEEALSKDRD